MMSTKIFDRGKKSDTRPTGATVTVKSVYYLFAMSFLFKRLGKLMVIALKVNPAKPFFCVRVFIVDHSWSERRLNQWQIKPR